MTRLTVANQTFNRPVLLPEGPATRCVIHGKELGWTNCTPCAFCMGIHATTGGRTRIDPCALRKETGDTSGGTTLRQNADATSSMAGIFVATYTGANVLRPERVAQYLLAGHRVVGQGNADALIGTSHQSTGGRVNHAALHNEGRGWHKVNGIYLPTDVLTYDPAADGRHASWGTAAEGPDWWPWSLCLKFWANLRPAGEDAARLGPGKVYAAVFPDSEPHYHALAGSTKATPFPDRARVNKATAAVYAAPNGKAKRLYALHDGDLVVLYQYVTGTSAWGSTRWGVNDSGTEFIPIGALRQVHGAT